MTSQEAADELNVSLEYLLGLLDDGKLPYRVVSEQHYLHPEDVAEYKKARSLRAQAALQDLVDQAQEMGLGY